jgi:FkbM family methyltransferase
MHSQSKTAVYAHKLLSSRSKLLDWAGGIGLRLYLYRQNLFFDPDVNGEHQFLEKLKARGFSPKTIFDIGANEGRWSSYVGNMWPDAVVHMFEPMAGIVARLTEKFAGRAQFHVHHGAVGAENGKIKVFENTELSSHSYVGASADDAPEVDVFSGPKCLELAGVEKVELCKIDTEGFDLAILKGLQKELATHRFSVIQFEHHQFAVSYGVRFADVTAMLRDCGYRVGKIYPEGIKEVRYGEHDWEYIIGPNFCAMSPDCHGLFESLRSR